jgi:hypothetical protein
MVLKLISQENHVGKEIVLWSRFPSKQQVLSFDEVAALQIRL